MHNTSHTELKGTMVGIEIEEETEMTEEDAIEIVEEEEIGIVIVEETEIVVKTENVEEIVERIENVEEIEMRAEVKELKSTLNTLVSILI